MSLLSRGTEALVLESKYPEDEKNEKIKPAYIEHLGKQIIINLMTSEESRYYLKWLSFYSHALFTKIYPQNLYLITIRG